MWIRLIGHFYLAAKSNIMQSAEKKKKQNWLLRAARYTYISNNSFIYSAHNTVMIVCPAIAANSGKWHDSAGILSFTLHAAEHVPIWS